MIVLAVDVGIQVCGYVLCNVKNLDVKLLEEGEIKPPRRDPLPKKLNQIYANLEEKIKEYTPECILVEKLY
jgi:Holliday junction resolvasome RuvABC endonuclease subunit